MKRASTAARMRSSAATAISIWPRCSRTARRAPEPHVRRRARRGRRVRRRARWDLLPTDRYMWGSVQTVRGCPKHCSFCSVWRTDGQKPRHATVGRGRRSEIVELRRKGFRFIVLADDNFYPVTLADSRMAAARADKQHAARRWPRCDEERFELMAALEQLPDDMVFYTQITMEAAEDPEFLEAMRRARIRGALVGVESVTPEGLKAVYKDFNMRGRGARRRGCRRFRRTASTCSARSSSACRPTAPDTFAATADLAQRAGVYVRAVRDADAVSRARWISRKWEQRHGGGRRAWTACR